MHGHTDDPSARGYIIRFSIQLNVNNELTHYDDVLNAMGKKGVKFLSKPGVITNTSVLAMRDGLNTATQLVGLDISKYLKFKPWGATKVANGLGSALAVVGLALEAWDSYKEHERQKQFEATIQEMISNFQQQSAEVRALVDAPDFAERFFPTFNTLKHQLSGIEQEMLSLQNQNERFHKWYDSGVAIDADFRDIHTNHSSAPAQWESVPTIELDTSSAVQALSSPPPCGQACQNLVLVTPVFLASPLPRAGPPPHGASPRPWALHTGARRYFFCSLKT